VVTFQAHERDSLDRRTLRRRDLAANGIDTVFGIPGVHNIELYRGLEFARLRHVLVRHEQNAGFAADGYARASGCAAAAFVISGPGVTNALTAIAQRIRFGAAAGRREQPVRASLGKGWGVLHELEDQRAVAAGVAGLARSARDAQDVRDHLRAAFATLHAGRARPAYLEIRSTCWRSPPPCARSALRAAAAHHPPSPRRSRPAQALLAEAQRPLIIAGGGARGAGGALRKLVEAVDGYLVTTVAGKGVIAESHPASLGASLPYAPTQELVAAADVVVAAGTELSETDVYTTTRLAMSGRLVRLDIDDQKLSDQFAADVLVRAMRARASRCWPTRAVCAAAGARRRVPARRIGRGSMRSLTPTHARASRPCAQSARSSQRRRAVHRHDPDRLPGELRVRRERPGLWFSPIRLGALGYALPAALAPRLRSRRGPWWRSPETSACSSRCRN